MYFNLEPDLLFCATLCGSTGLRAIRELKLSRISTYSLHCGSIFGLTKIKV